MIKLLRLVARVYYWRSRALKAEEALGEFRLQAEAEANRNREREDVFVSAAVLGGRGMIGLAPRSGPAAQPQPHRLAESPDPWTATTAMERMEFNTQWVPLGLEKGFSMQKMQQDFLRELASRKQFNDEPSM